MGQCDSVHDDLRPCGDLDSLQSKEALMGWSLVNVNLSHPPHDILWLWEAISPNLLFFRYPSPEFLECRTISVSDFNSIPPAKSIFSPSRAIYTGHGCGSKNNPLRLKSYASLVQFLLSHSFPVTEKSAGYLLGGWPFPFSWHNFINGPMWLGSW